MTFESLSLGGSWCSGSLGLVLRRFFPFFLFRPAEPPAQYRARIRGKRLYLRRRTVAFSSLLNFALPTPSSAQSRGATRVLCSRVTWYRDTYGPVCFFCVVFVLLFFRLNTSPPRGAVGEATFHPGYLSFPRLTRRHTDGPREVFGMTSPLY